MDHLNEQHRNTERLILAFLLALCLFFSPVIAHAECFPPWHCFFGNSYCCATYSEASDKLSSFGSLCNVSVVANNRCGNDLSQCYIFYQQCIDGIPIPSSSGFIYFANFTDTCSGSGDPCCGDPFCGSSGSGGGGGGSGPGPGDPGSAGGPDSGPGLCQ